MVTVFGVIGVIAVVLYLSRKFRLSDVRSKSVSCIVKSDNDDEGLVETHNEGDGNVRYRRRAGERRVFYQNISGYSGKNDDGTDRQHIIRECQAGDEVELRVDAEQPPSKRIAVFTKHGQIGFIEAYHSPVLARELTIEHKRFSIEIAAFDSREYVRIGKTDISSRKGNTQVKLRFGVLELSTLEAVADASTDTSK